ncbi:MAG: hypothetical protein RLZZ361_882 [Cyanobacteriota bacterium]
MYQDLHYKFIERLRRDSNYKKWCWGKESNPRPPDYKSDALPTELPQHGGLKNASDLSQMSFFVFWCLVFSLLFCAL